jgi:toxin ParE1/3/4
LIDAAIPLEAFPELGIARPDLGDGVRSLAVGAYLIFYRPREGGVVIERVLDGRRDIGPRFF